MTNYKIEKKPIFWKVIVMCGAYSDYSEDFYVIAANSKEEAQVFFKQYWDESNTDCLVFENGEKFISTSMRQKLEKCGREINWDTEYGDAVYVSISILEVIHIQKLNSKK